MKYGEGKHISNDPFALYVAIIRRTVIAESTIEQQSFSCAWCGDPGKKVKQGRRLFQYGVFEDTRCYFNDETFCSKSCCDAYKT